MWSVALTEEHALQMFENKFFRKLFSFEQYEVSGVPDSWFEPWKPSPCMTDGTSY
jgi:hypothetical protein